jgi:hypothetical protein
MAPRRPRGAIFVGSNDELSLRQIMSSMRAGRTIRIPFFRAFHAGRLDCFVARAPKKKQRLKALIFLEPSSEASPHPEERAFLGVRLEASS